MITATYHMKGCPVEEELEPALGTGTLDVRINTSELELKGQRPVELEDC